MAQPAHTPRTPARSTRAGRARGPATFPSAGRRPNAHPAILPQHRRGRKAAQRVGAGPSGRRRPDVTLFPQLSVDRADGQGERFEPAGWVGGRVPQSRQSERGFAVGWGPERAVKRIPSVNRARPKDIPGLLSA
jgi:hypothetical protein